MLSFYFVQIREHYINVILTKLHEISPSYEAEGEKKR